MSNEQFLKQKGRRGFVTNRDNVNIWLEQVENEIGKDKKLKVDESSLFLFVHIQFK